MRAAGPTSSSVWIPAEFWADCKSISRRSQYRRVLEGSPYWQIRRRRRGDCYRGLALRSRHDAARPLDLAVAGPSSIGLKPTARRRIPQHTHPLRTLLPDFDHHVASLPNHAGNYMRIGYWRCCACAPWTEARPSCERITPCYSHARSNTYSRLCMPVSFETTNSNG
jgi:hypothetical protein